MNPKIILITGTSSGFGLLTAARLASKGHIVYATMRNINKKQDLENELIKRNTAVIIRPLDVTKPETITPVINEIIQNHGRIDILINNAGYGLGGFFEDLTDTEIRHQIEVNFFGVQHMCRAVIGHMRQQKSGQIINISSIAGQSGTPALGAYNASKWALEGFSESLYHELNMFGIHVILIEPGSYPTKIFKDNAHYCQNYNNPQSIYYPYSQKLKSFVDKYVRTSKKDPEVIAKIIEKIINTKNPKLRYTSDFSSWLRIVIGKLLPPALYQNIFRKAIYGNKDYPV